MTTTDPTAIRRAAVFHHAVTLLSFDAPLNAAIKDDCGLTHSTVRQIAAEYLVARTIKGLGEKAGVIAEQVNELAKQTGGATLLQSADECIAVAENLGDSGRLPVSAVSKLLWFLRNDGSWTLYDSFACRAVEMAGAGVKRFKGFYRKLEDAGFHCAVAAINDAMPASFDGLCLHPERIIDAHLVLIGAPSPEARHALVRRARHVEATLPVGLRATLTDFADRISSDDACWLAPSYLKKT